MIRALVIGWTITRVVVAVLLIGWAVLHVRGLDSAIGVRLPVQLKPLGMVIIAFGGCVVLLCGAMLSTPRVLPTEFVSRGPFRYVRNPMSMGAIAMMFGLGLFCGSISILLSATLLFFLIHIFVVFVEEPGLGKRFGESYLRYKHSVNRWVPRLNRSGPIDRLKADSENAGR